MALYFSKRNKSNWYWMVFTSKQKFTTEFESNWAIILKKNYLPQSRWLLLNNPLDLVSGIIWQNSLCLLRTIVKQWDSGLLLVASYLQAVLLFFFFFFLQWVASVDLFPNEEAHANVVVTKTDSWTEQNEEVCNICV